MKNRVKSKLAIAIDGPAGAGKSTVAKAVAKALAYTYVDTGAMYRAVTWKCLQDNVDVKDSQAVAKAVGAMRLRFEHAEDGPDKIFVNDVDVTEAIRRPDVGDAVAWVAQVPSVRETMVSMQRALGQQGGVVMDGRDIGTVVLPDAQLKVFLTASEEERALRRYRELKRGSEDVTVQGVLESLRRRDRQDATRAVSPLAMAGDAIRIDTTGRGVDEVVAEILRLCEAKGGGGGCSTS